MVGGAVAVALTAAPAFAVGLPVTLGPLPTVLPTVSPTAVPLPLPTPTELTSLLPPPPGTSTPAGTPTVVAPTAPTAPTTGTTSTATFQPSPEEQQALPNEPERIAYEAQQYDVFQQLASIDVGQLAKLHLQGGGGDGVFGWPVAVDGRPPLTQRFGCTDLAGEPFKSDCPSKRWHTGIDLAYPSGTPVYAAADGVAKLVSSGAGYGNYVLLAHGSGYSTLYGHLTAFAVPDGTVVTRGELIGFVGSTGFSTGSHLHFEVRYDHDYLDPCAELSC